MKICVIPDIHGSSAWREVVNQEIQQVDRFVFLGDYFDSKDGLPNLQEEAGNFREIVHFAQKHQAVDLLIGNHDLQYIGGAKCSGYQPELGPLVNNTLQELVSSGQLKCTAQWGRYLFSHAGLSRVWMKLMRYDAVEVINREFQANSLSLDFSPYAREMNDYSGDSIYQGPLWIRPEALDEAHWEGTHQVVGHTPLDEISYLPAGEYRIIFCDTKLRQYLIIDTETEEENICEVAVANR